jgi:hypothetical protein
MRSSFSQNSTYINCPMAWKHQYIDGYSTEIEGSSLYFGTAIDRAVIDMLDGKPDWLQTFYNAWEFQAKDGKGVRILDNDKITYSHKDFDGDLLEQKDFLELEKWAKDFNLIGQAVVPTNQMLLDLFKQCSKAKSNPYIKMTDEQFKYFNRCSWLGLKRKGKLLLQSFDTQVRPKITKVISTQKRSKIEDTNTGDQMIGYVDMILELQGYDKPIIFDLKTSAFPYDQHQLDVSPQLTLYAAMEAKNHNTNLVGYIILHKNVNKDIVAHCDKCNIKKNTRHLTCNSLDSAGVRCGGNWNENKVPKPEVQIMIAEKSQAQIDDLLLDTGNILLAMKNQIVYKNTNKCNDWYSQKCPFYGLCHGGDISNLKKKDKS